MSRFLRVGLISDGIGDIIEAASTLLVTIDPHDRKSAELAGEILDIARDLKEFLSRWSSEPIIYTGGGTTDEVICMLDALITKAENGSSPDLLRRLSKV
jgi:hypothetical protein